MRSSAKQRVIAWALGLAALGALLWLVSRPGSVALGESDYALQAGAAQDSRSEAAPPARGRSDARGDEAPSVVHTGIRPGGDDEIPGYTAQELSAAGLTRRKLYAQAMFNRWMNVGTALVGFTDEAAMRGKLMQIVEEVGKATAEHEDNSAAQARAALAVERRWVSSLRKEFHDVLDQPTPIGRPLGEVLDRVEAAIDRSSDNGGPSVRAHVERLEQEHLREGPGGHLKDSTQEEVDPKELDDESPEAGRDPEQTGSHGIEDALQRKFSGAAGGPADSPARPHK